MSDKITFDRRSSTLALVTISMISFYPYSLYTGDLASLASDMGYPATAANRSFASSTFSIYNLSDTASDPRIHDVLTSFKGASTNLKIENLTTGDIWQYIGTSVSGDEITLDGVFSRKNGFSIFANTNHELLTLAPGENQIRITGAIDTFTIEFDFPTYKF